MNGIKNKIGLVLIIVTLMLKLQINDLIDRSVALVSILANKTIYFPARKVRPTFAINHSRDRLL